MNNTRKKNNLHQLMKKCFHTPLSELGELYNPPAESFDELERRVITHGEYKGKKFTIATFMTPSAYIESSTAVALTGAITRVERSKLFKDYFDNLNHCHGGVSWVGRIHFPDGVEYNAVGWDYGHCDDYNSLIGSCWEGDRCDKWTIEEIFADIKNVIDSGDIERVEEKIKMEKQGIIDHFYNVINKTLPL